MHEEAKINNLLIKLKILEKSQLAEHKGRKTSNKSKQNREQQQRQRHIFTKIRDLTLQS